MDRINEIKHIGALKSKLDTIDIKSYELKAVVVKALIEAGYDVTVEPIFNKFDAQIGERLTVHKAGGY